MKEDFSEENIKRNCPSCDANSSTFEFVLERTKYFHVICDPNPLTEGHLLIISKDHLPCVGEYRGSVLNEFMALDKLVSKFVLENYGSVSSFEHGKFGQTIFHSHTHYLPFNGSAEDIITEGRDKLSTIRGIKDLQKYYRKDGGYLYLSTGDKKWIVSPSLASPRFFRDRFANALHCPERGDWKAMRSNKSQMKIIKNENAATQKLWLEKRKRPEIIIHN